MPSRGVLKSPALLGSTYKRNGGWRVTAFIEKRSVHGPLRTTEAQAEEDLAAARTKASHQEFRKFLRDLASSASESAAEPVADAASSRGSEVPERATGQPTGLESAAATPRKRCRVKSPAKPSHELQGSTKTHPADWPQPRESGPAAPVGTQASAA